MKLEIQDRSAIEKAIVGALKSTIAAHGPITEYWTGSAAKRVYGLLKQRAREEHQETLTATESVVLLRDALLRARGALMQHGNCACGMHYYGPWKEPRNDGRAPTLVQGQSFGMGRCLMCYTLQDDIDPALRLTADDEQS